MNIQLKWTNEDDSDQEIIFPTVETLVYIKADTDMHELLDGTLEEVLILRRKHYRIVFSLLTDAQQADLWKFIIATKFRRVTKVDGVNDYNPVKPVGNPGYPSSLNYTLELQRQTTAVS
jgi:hypothetical protein